MTDFRLKTLADADDAPPSAQCGCGRAQVTDMMFDVSDWTPGERSSKGWASDTTHICDGCLTMALRTGAITLTELHEKHGAPSDVLTQIETIESQ